MPVPPDGLFRAIMFTSCWSLDVTVTATTSCLGLDGDGHTP
jgi:hypothetical protein